MNRTRLEQIERIYQAVVDLPPEKRAQSLDEACSGDDEVRREVESLLRYDGSGPNFLDTPPALLAAEIAAEGRETVTLMSEQISHYKVERFLGEGGMGEVYLAADTRLQRRVALKVLSQLVAGDSERLLRFEREARAASALNHPNILTVHEFGEAGGIHYIASEFVDGETLRQKLNSGMLQLTEALEIAIQVTSALTAAHEAGITHRDIKPENIMVRRDGYVKVLDFGLAKLREDERPSRVGTEDPTRAMLHTEPGAVMGTDAYMSPEQARGLSVDARTDIWSVGVLLFEMLTGERPFKGATRADVIVSVLSADPPLMTSLRSDIPPELEWIVSKALTKDAEARCQTSNELRADLIRITKQIEFEETVSRSAERKPRPDDAQRKETNHSTIRTGLKTAEDQDRGTNGGRDVAPPSPASGTVEALFRQGRSHKGGFALLVAAIIALVSFGAYFALGPAGGTEIDSVAVLPFENLSGNPELTYAADGLSQSLIDRLAQLRQLKVISRNSSFKFRGPNIDLRSVAAQLGVRAVVTGSVSQIGEDLVIRIEIIDAAEDRHLTGGQYRRRASDLLAVQNEIAQAAAEQLRVKLTGAQSKRLTDAGTEHSDAYRYYLNGLVDLNGPQDVRGRALEYFEKAVELDPEFAPPHVEIAWIYWSRANASSDPHESMPKARTATERALELDPDFAKAHALRAMVHEYEFDWAAAEREYRRAIELSPNLDFARNNYAFFLSIMGRQAEALSQLEEQRIRDPINRRLWLLQKAIILTQARRFDDALAAYQDAQAVEPAREIPSFAVGYAYAGKGMHNEAVGYYRKSVELLGGEEEYSQPLVYLAAAFAKMPETKNEARRILSRIEQMDEYSSPALLAVVYAALGDNDKAIQLLEQAYIKRDLLLRFIGTAYEYDALRDDPRFADLLNRIGLDQ